MGRPYDNSARERQARTTRRTIVETAQRLLLDGGYPAMTVASLASAAGVSPQTVYNSLGGKAAVVKAVYDRMMAGDDEKLAMSDRPEFRALFEATDRAAFVRAYAAWVRLLSGRVGPLWGVLLAHGTDATLADLVATTERERHTGVTHALTGMRERLGVPEDDDAFEHLIDGVWALIAPDVYDRLVRRSGWSPAEYEQWLARQLAVLLI